MGGLVLEGSVETTLKDRYGKIHCRAIHCRALTVQYSSIYSAVQRNSFHIGRRDIVMLFIMLSTFSLKSFIIVVCNFLTNFIY